jgi:hypothetical protein
VSVQIFVDESKAAGFLLAAAAVPCSEVDRLRAAVGALHLRHQVRIHFRREQTTRQRKILETLNTVGGISAVIYDATRFNDHKAGRNAAISRLADDAARMQASRIVLESDDSVVEQDRLIIAKRLKQAELDDVIGVDHCRASGERLLAIPDAVVWCYAKGGPWRRDVMPLVKEVIELLGARDVRSPAHLPSDRLPGSTSRGGAARMSIMYRGFLQCQPKLFPPCVSFALIRPFGETVFPGFMATFARPMRSWDMQVSR